MIATGSKRILFVFGKYPSVGRVKTRLASSVGYSAARRIYESFLADAACRFLSPRATDSFVVKWVYTPAWSAFPQLIMSMQSCCASREADRILAEETAFVGFDIEDIGTLQATQLDWARKYGYEMAVIVGTDTPHIDRKTISDAFERLKNHDIVIGPSTDGGYYLLGVNKFWGILSGIDMTTNHVVDDIVLKAGVSRKSVDFVETMTDIDDWNDLKLLIEVISKANGEPCPATWATLQELGLVKKGRLERM